MSLISARIEESVRVPTRTSTLPGFRRWAQSDAFPEDYPVSFLDGELWIDMSPEDLYCHNKVKGEYGAVLTILLKTHRIGSYFCDGARLSNVSANLSTTPDGVFVTWEAFKAGRVRQIRGKQGFIELEGTPDMVLEVVSATSVKKDTVDLRDQYWRAGIPEYWLVDARGLRPEFDILRRARHGYVRTRRVAGWLSSRVLGKSFKLLRGEDELGNPAHTLRTR